MSENTHEQRPQTLQDIEIPAPDGKRTRAYDADYVDQVLAQAQEALDARAKRLQEARSYIVELEQREPEVVAAPPAQDNSHHDIAARSSELLARAAQIADEHVREAQDTAAGLIAEAEARIHNATQDAEQARRVLETDISRLAQAKASAVRDLEGLLGSHLSALQNFVRQTEGEKPVRTDVRPPRPETPVKVETLPEQVAPVKKETPVVVEEVEEEDALDEL